MIFSALLQVIKEDWQAYGRDWTLPGFLRLAFYRFGVWRMQIRSKWLRAPFSVLYRLLYRHACNMYGIELPYNAQIGRRIVFENQHAMVIHGRSEIGDDSVIRHGVTLGNRYLSLDAVASIIGRLVNAGAGAKILGVIRLSDDCQVGATGVVLCSANAYSILVGSPARTIKAHIKHGEDHD